MEQIWLTLSSSITLPEATIQEIINESELNRLIFKSITEKGGQLRIKASDFTDYLLDYRNALKEYADKKISTANADELEDLMMHYNREIVAIQYFLHSIPQQNECSQSNKTQS